MTGLYSGLRSSAHASVRLAENLHDAKSLWPASPCREILVQVYEKFRHPLRSSPCGSVLSPRQPSKLRRPKVLLERAATTRAECEARAPKLLRAGHLRLRTESR